MVWSALGLTVYASVAIYSVLHGARRLGVVMTALLAALVALGSCLAATNFWSGSVLFALGLASAWILVPLLRHLLHGVKAMRDRHHYWGHI